MSLIAAPFAILAILYAGGFLAQLLGNYATWKQGGGIPGDGTSPLAASPDFLLCLSSVLRPPYGVYGILICIGLLAVLLIMVMRMGYGDAGEYDEDRNFSYSAKENRNIGEVYRLLTLNGESQLDTLFEALPSTHPAKAPYSLFKQASDTVRSGVIIGLGSRLQVFQSELIKKITAKNEIDLELPGQQPCAYFLVTSDQDSTFDFLASLFLSFCFIKLVRYADHNCEGGKLPVPVHILGEELTACGTIPDLSRRLSVIRSRNISMSCVFQNLAGLQNRYPQNLWQEIIGNCDAQLFLGCTDQLTAEFISARTGLASVAVSSKSKQLGTWRISNYTPEFRETSGVGKRPVLTPDEVLRLPLDQALIIIRGKKVLQVDKMDYSKHPEAKYLRSCKASAHVPEWRRLEEEAAKTPQPAPKPAPAAKKPAKRKATKPASPTDKSPKEAPAPKSAGTPEGIITTDKDSILS